MKIHSNPQSAPVHSIFNILNIPLLLAKLRTSSSELRSISGHLATHNATDLILKFSVSQLHGSKKKTFLHFDVFLARAEQERRKKRNI